MLWGISHRTGWQITTFLRAVASSQRTYSRTGVGIHRFGTFSLHRSNLKGKDSCRARLSEPPANQSAEAHYGL